jgi:Glycosyl hydrolases family 2, sugar binding domain/Glycosyl hydrolases family 2, TIM barrel domain/Glycosyl hydrolases family 2
MSRYSLLAALLLGLALPARAEDWKPAPCPIPTRWAKEIDPKKGPPLPEYPRPQLVRKQWQNLNGLWQYAEAKADGEAPAGKALDGRILVPFPVESSLSGVGKHLERLWYRRTFTVPKAWAGQRVLLHFGAVDWEATVYVNGKKQGTHKGGYDPFSFDVTDALKKDGEQELIVGVFDPTDKGTQPRGKQVLKPSGIYYTPVTGIWQTVWLEPVPAVRIEGFTVTTDVGKGEATFKFRFKGATDKHRVAIRATAGRGAARRVTVRRPATDEAVKVAVFKDHLWSPDRPNLYDLEVRLMDGDTEVDRVTSYFGLRSIEVKPGEGKGPPRLLLNGKELFQMGPLDQGFWPDGIYTAPTDAALKYDVEITKKLGFNMTRKHVKVEPARWYYHCDRLGLLVWQDMPSGEKSIPQGKPDIVRSKESAQQFERELKAMIDALHNHPCIVCWVVFNEGWGQYDTARMAKWTKEHDPTRLVDSASGWNDRKVGDMHDVHVYPGPGMPPVEKGRAAVLGEFGGLGLPIKGHLWEQKTWSYRGVRDKADLTRKYERLLRRVYDLKAKGLTAAVYTQITDVETEANGLLTYDRAVIKVDADRVAAANKGDFSRVPELEELVPSSEKKAQTWRYTLAKPEAGWQKGEFDDSAWKKGEGGFGTKGTPGVVVRTVWKTKDIWLRREVELPKGDLGDVLLWMHHDEDAHVYINGVLAVEVKGYTTGYEEYALTQEGRKALKPGKNLIAIHCKQTGGGQYIDAGLVRVKPPPKK